MNARSALKNTYAGGIGAASFIPPWGVDADAIIALNGHPFASSNRTPATVAFIGVGSAGADSATSRIVSDNWSYGLGTTLPLGSTVDLFADSRWRIARFVLPTASPRPSRIKELRFGLTLHFSASNNGRDPRRGSR